MNEPTVPQERSLAPGTRCLKGSRLGLKFPAVCLAAYWIAALVVAVIDKAYFIAFLSALISTTFITLVFLGWWLFNRGLRPLEKLTGLVLIVAEACLVGKLADRSIDFFTLWMGGVPLVATVIVGWLFVSRRLPPLSTRLGFVVLVSLTWALFLVIRQDGADSQLKIKRHWRWTATEEQAFLARARPNPGLSKPAAEQNVSVKAGPLDWTGFRGAARDGVAHGTSIPTNWTTTAPSPFWKREVGPAWSSLIVVGDRLFTQEQRGDQETVVCYDANTGHELWAHTDPARFEESLSGPGPRSTPTFDQGKVFALGGTGILNGLDAASGRGLWHHDIKEVSGAKTPMWAFSSSPLVAGGLVIVYAGGGAGKSLLAYREDSGELAWTAPAGRDSYSSPQLTTLAGVPQVLMFHDGGLTAVDLQTGKQLWQTGTPMKGAPRCGQPHLIAPDSLLVGMLDDAGCSRIAVAKTPETWTTTTSWKSRGLKPEFPDLVVDHGYAYGFDVGIFCCLNLADGKRAWKDGRYGSGQVILLADQDLLLVSSETGELVLLQPDPSERREVGRFQALHGKTWNHPVVRRDRIYLRNAEEMACYALPPRAAGVASTR